MCRRMEEEGESEGVREAMKRKKRTEMERVSDQGWKEGRCVEGWKRRVKVKECEKQ